MIAAWVVARVPGGKIAVFSRATYKASQRVLGFVSSHRSRAAAESMAQWRREQDAREAVTS